MQNHFETPFGEYYGSLESEARATLAEEAGTSRQYLWALARGKRQAGIDMCSRLMRADANITLGMLRPDQFED